MTKTCMFTGDATNHPRGLDEIIRCCLSDSLDSATSKYVRIHHDVDDNLKVYRNASRVGRVLLHVLKSVVSVSEKNQIRISAKTYSDVVLIHLRNAFGLDEDMVRPALMDIQADVEEMGGFLDITSHRPSETTITFSFPNIPDFNNLN